MKKTIMFTLFLLISSSATFADSVFKERPVVYGGFFGIVGTSVAEATNLVPLRGDMETDVILRESSGTEKHFMVDVVIILALLFTSLYVLFRMLLIEKENIHIPVLYIYGYVVTIIMFICWFFERKENMFDMVFSFEKWYFTVLGLAVPLLLIIFCAKEADSKRNTFIYIVGICGLVSAYYGFTENLSAVIQGTVMVTTLSLGIVLLQKVRRMNESEEEWKRMLE